PRIIGRARPVSPAVHPSSIAIPCLRCEGPQGLSNGEMGSIRASAKPTRLPASGGIHVVDTPPDIGGGRWVNRERPRPFDLVTPVPKRCSVERSPPRLAGARRLLLKRAWTLRWTQAQANGSGCRKAGRTRA